MPMNNPMALFVHELGDIYDAEHRILAILQTLASESQEPQATRAYQMHEQQMRQQIQNLDQVFQILGQQPQRIPCLAVQGLKQEHDTFLMDNPTPDMLTMFDLGAAFKTEHYEIASYMGLIEKAQLMGQQQAVQLLQQNLQQEQEMARIVQQVSMQLGQQQIWPMTQTGQAHQATQVNP